jgi:pSer/pThr/pTyr-binding forkhead associated (FHA) protein
LAITKNRSLVGRSRRADLMLGDDSVSRTHALLWYDAGGRWIQDLASSNGSTLNGAAVHGPTLIHDADVLGFGTARFSYRPA